MARTLTELGTEVLAHGFDSNRYRTRVETWIKECAHRTARTVRLNEATATLTVSVGDDAYDLPSDFLRAETLRNTADRVILEPLTIKEFDQGAEASGKPTSYALIGDEIRLYPTPNLDTSLELRYWRNFAAAWTGSETTTDIGFPEDYEDVLITYALAKAYRSEDDPEMSTFYWGEHTREVGVMRGDLQKRERGHVRRIQGLTGGSGGPRFIKP